VICGLTLDHMPVTRGVRVAIAVAVVAMLASCRPGAGATTARSTIPVGHSTRMLTVDGVERTVLLYRPKGIDAPAPLVVMMHGGFGNAQQAENSYGWDQQADKGGFIVAYPDGTSRAWNAGTCCGLPAATHVDDVGFVVDAVKSLEADSAIDASRVYATGMSNGAMLAYRLACETDVFAAVAPVAGTILVDCSAAKPTSVLHIHGVADENVPYAGGPGKAVTVTGAPRVDGPSVQDDIARWRSIDACAEPTSQVEGVVSTSTSTCPAGRTVELISIAGAGHQWPGSKPNPGAQLLGADPPSTAIDATAVIWEFFSAHSR
jgi:polyhydroxybutyrate depolymerase